MWVVVTMVKYSDGIRRPVSAAGPFEDRRAAKLWADKMRSFEAYEILELSYIRMKSVDGPALLVPAGES
jgi:hypothetical protein